MPNDLIAALDRYFELVHADDDGLRMEVYRLRYQVYVVETGFERSEHCRQAIGADGLPYFWEEDSFDRRADHFLLRHRASGLYAATARLILPHPEDACSLFPIEWHCELDRPVLGAAARGRLAEISRFAVSKAFKKRAGEAGTLAGVADDIERYFQEDERRVLPHLSLGLFAAVMRMVHAHGIRHSYAVMEPALKRLLARFGVLFEQIGPEADYHGARVPCLISADSALGHIKQAAPHVWDLITERGALVGQPG
ncbi:PEP-CTERM/exosortase system-associated acyltransferase [Parasulfuritortus cantonensis]|uniref:PEP-CTERM/exosortase system-associated acyltransferase n=1 Tax=Parasulfuritortus cantonensis TaxID=2528202 RepID=A0A4R1BDM0_9PROT|nr:PEP-CTERM/exosortase system-associated acyltransferase [Parasulfuritortus cantonensis]TCJ15180.1 PEP-CTERM/exosortase system-associated acyltransferase [Parasulfuritortus cantonensis]